MEKNTRNLLIGGLIAAIALIALARGAYQATERTAMNEAKAFIAAQPWLAYKECLKKRSGPVPSWASSQEACISPE